MKNPHTSLSAKKGIYKPTPDSRYFINEELKEHFMKYCQDKIDTHTHINPQLDIYDVAE